MIIRKYLFAKECYMGLLTVDTDTGEKKVDFAPGEELSDYAGRYRDAFRLDSTECIDLWISERTIPEERPDRSVALGFWGLPANAGRLEIFLAGHGVSTQDCVWHDDVKSNDWWYQKLSHRFDGIKSGKEESL